MFQSTPTTEKSYTASFTRSAPDEALLARIADGDKDALSLLYEQTSTAVYGFALSILKNPQDAQDVMQDSYLHIFRNAYWYRPMGKPMAWILTVVRNLALMRLRDEKHAPMQLEEQQTNCAMQNDYDDSLDRMVLQAALRVLPDMERQIVMLFSIAGLKHREIARLLELPLSTVLSKYRRALGKLKKELEKENTSHA